MKALFLAEGKIRLRKIPEPVPLKNEAVVKVLRAGICNTDLELIKGYMEFEGVLGHEFVGRVVHSPDSQWLNKRVVGEINIACGCCRCCLQGRAKHCPDRTVLGISGRAGAFAEYLSLPVDNLHQVPDSVSDRAAVFVEPLAAACDILDKTDIDETLSVAVLGDGKLGLLASQVVRLKTPQVCCFGKHAKKLELLQQSGIQVSTRVKDESRKFDIVVEATGKICGLKQSLAIVRPEGQIILKSTLSQQVPLDMSKIVVDEIRLTGSRCGPFDKAIDLLSGRKIAPENLVRGEYPLERFEEAFRAAADAEVIKVLFVL